MTTAMNLTRRTRLPLLTAPLLAAISAPSAFSARAALTTLPALSALAAIIVGLLLASPPARAHDDATLDAMASAHGGQLRMAGAQHFELVLAPDGSAAKPSPITVYVTDHAGNKLATAGASASITLLTGQAKVTKVSTTLKPAGENQLIGSAAYVSAPGLKAVLTVTLPGQPAQQARFTPLAPRAGSTAGH